MIVIDEMKIYGFKKVVLPKNKDLFSRFGKRLNTVPTSSDSIPMSMDKLGSLEYMDRLDKASQREEDYARYVAFEQERAKSVENQTE